MDMDSLQYIDDFFNDRLTEEQKKQWEERVHSDESFAEEVAFYLSANGLLKDEVAAEKKERFRVLYEQNRTTAPLVRPLKRIGVFVAAAVVLCLVAALWLLFVRQAGPQQLADAYIGRHLQTLGVSMSSRRDSLQNALSLYNKDSLPEALHRFEQIIRTDTSDYTAKEYAGLVCLRMKEYDKALAWFQQLETYTGLYSNPALFYQSITLIKRDLPGDTQKAKQLLQQVVDRDLEGKETAQQWLKKW